MRPRNESKAFSNSGHAAWMVDSSKGMSRLSAGVSSSVTLSIGPSAWVESIWLMINVYTRPNRELANMMSDVGHRLGMRVIVAEGRFPGDPVDAAEPVETTAHQQGMTVQVGGRPNPLPIERVRAAIARFV